jgi:pimeloyl-ACP methyl ester carboxylesterase
MLRWLRRVLLALVAAAIASAVAQQVLSAKELARYPPPGTLVDVGDHKLHLWCEGEGAPTVLLESSGLGTCRGFSKVIELLKPHVRVCAYDRAGMGWSEPSPRALSTAELVADLEHLIAAAKLQPPFVIAAASIGGLTAELYTRTHPQAVRALVMVDAVDSAALPELAPELSALASRVCIAAPAAGLGVLRWLDLLGLSAESAALTYRPAPFYAACSLLRSLPQSDRELAEAPPWPAQLPLLVLRHTEPRGFLPPGNEAKERAFEPVWQKVETQLAQRTTKGRLQAIDGSGHLIAADRPELVAGAVLSMVNP